MKVRIFLINGYKYEGKLEREDEHFISIIDAKTEQVLKFPMTSVLSITHEAD